MNKRAIWVSFFSLALLAACEKPSESDCKRAVVNIRQLMGTSKMSIDNSQDATWIRSCRGTAKKKSVACAIDAKSLDGLKVCGLLKGAELDDLMKIEQDLQKLRNDAAPPVAVDAGVAIDAAAATDAADPTDAAAAATGTGSTPPVPTPAPGPGSGSAPKPTTP